LPGRTWAASIAGAVAFIAFNAAGSGGQEGHAFGYAALILELLAYAAQMTYLPTLSKRYKPLTLTAMYYTVATLASAATLIVRDRDDLLSVRTYPLYYNLYFVSV
jgi:drug/metabolite transporter (DMT)-like permease